MPTQPYRDSQGKRLPSVTTILEMYGEGSKGLMHWAWEQGRDGKNLYEEQAKVAKAGTVAHGLAEKWIKKQPIPTLNDLIEKYGPDCAKAAWGGYQGFGEWTEQTRLKVVASEVPLISDRLGYGGTLDAIVVFQDMPGLLDFKSSKRLYKKVIPQIAAYSDLWDEAHPDMKVQRHYVLRWGPDGDHHQHGIPPPWIECGHIIFNACKDIHNASARIRI